MTPNRILAASCAAAAAALLATGCGEKCATETPEVQQVATCPVLAPNAPVTVQVRICPTCNQTLPTCQGADIQGTFIQLDPVVEACDESNSCPPSCLVDSISCSFTTPAPGTYTLTILDPKTGAPRQQQVVIAAGGGTSCALASGPG